MWGYGKSIFIVQRAEHAVMGETVGSTPTYLYNYVRTYPPNVLVA